MPQTLMRPPACVQAAVRGCDRVYHLAALIGIPCSYRAPQSYVRTNIGGTFNVLDACREAGVERLLHTSTSEVYGSPQSIPIDESHRLHAQSPYAATKSAAVPADDRIWQEQADASAVGARGACRQRTGNRRGADVQPRRCGAAATNSRP